MMSTSEKQIISTYNMNKNAIGLADFIDRQVAVNVYDYHNYPTVYIMDEEGNHVQQAKFEEIKLEDGSKIYSVVLKFDK